MLADLLFFHTLAIRTWKNASWFYIIMLWIKIFRALKILSLRIKSYRIGQIHPLMKSLLLFTLLLIMATTNLSHSSLIMLRLISIRRTSLGPQFFTLQPREIKRSHYIFSIKYAKWISILETIRKALLFIGLVTQWVRLRLIIYWQWILILMQRTRRGSLLSILL